MKNTKSLLSTGIILAIALFTLIQADPKERIINPHLTEDNVANLQECIKSISLYISTGVPTVKDEEMKNELLVNGDILLRNCDKILYNNQPVSQTILDRVQEQEQEWIRMLIFAYR
jgi:hypothetical protein